MYDLVELRGVGKDEKKALIKSGSDLEKLETERDQLQKRALEDVGSMTKLRYAVRCSQ